MATTAVRNYSANFEVAVLLFGLLFSLRVESQPAKPLTQKEACRQFMPAVVRIDVADGNASGFIVSSDGWIITAGHVVVDPHTGERREAILVRLPNRKSSLAKVFVDQASAVKDFALLKVDAANLPFLQLATTDEVVPGTDLTIIGYPFSAESKFSQNITAKFCLSALAAATDTISQNGVNVDTIYFQGPAVKGLSGSPVISRDTGHVIGIQSQKLAGIGVRLNSIRDQITNFERTTGGHFFVMGTDLNADVVSLIDVLDRHLANGLGVATGADDAARFLTVTKREYDKQKR